MALLDVQGLSVRYPTRRGPAHALENVSFTLEKGRVLGVVGESGCGKTSTITEILALAKPSAGRIVVLGRDTASMGDAERFAIRRDLQIVFQDPMASLRSEEHTSELQSH